MISRACGVIALLCLWGDRLGCHRSQVGQPGSGSAAGLGPAQMGARKGGGRSRLNWLPGEGRGLGAVHLPDYRPYIAVAKRSAPGAPDQVWAGPGASHRGSLLAISCGCLHLP